MTIVERVAAAIAASRTGTITNRDAYLSDAEQLIAHYRECLASRSEAMAKER